MDLKYGGIWAQAHRVYQRDFVWPFGLCQPRLGSLVWLFSPQQATIEGEEEILVKEEENQPMYDDGLAHQFETFWELEVLDDLHNLNLGPEMAARWTNLTTTTWMMTTGTL